MRYRLSYLPLFWEDLYGAASYVARELGNPPAAEAMVDAAERGILAHLENPTLCATYRDGRKRDHSYYRFPVGNYWVFYVVVGDVMEVRRFLYKARDLPGLLL